jgi:hypothetical protein
MSRSSPKLAWKIASWNASNSAGSSAWTIALAASARQGSAVDVPPGG